MKEEKIIPQIAMEGHDHILERSGVSSGMTRKEAVSAKEELLWVGLEQSTVQGALEKWFLTLQGHTRTNYISAFNRLTDLEFLRLDISLQNFSLINHSAVVDRIKLVSEWSESTRQARAAAYIAFTRFLSRRTEGLIERAEPSREGTSKTFFKVRDKVSTPSMNRSEWTRFLAVLKEMNSRDCLIGKLALQGGKRISEVLDVTTEDVLWAEKRIRYRQSKTKGTYKEIWITYPDHILEELCEYIGQRQGLIFVTRTGKSVRSYQVWRSFVRAGEKAKIPCRVTPHVLRTSLVTYLKIQGFSDSDIMSVTGHCSAEMIHAYDKRELHDNVSQGISLV